MEITNYGKALIYVREEKVKYFGWECTDNLYRLCDKVEDLLISLDNLGQREFDKLCIDNYVENCIDEIKETVEEILYY